ncbi:hypothetical protein [Mamestra configurata nucleopolyhedrovirus A]|uniref:Ac17 n=1 Tax=Mamestra configurata nucleopolyhedrovirus TaxID=207830 RepID=Q8QLJ3_NPVMC|nr:hypothetical protein McnAVgp041 [Mamestra configurata nucleopolyhedrovirus A]AAM09149.1 unknown [Mamestra configurata nucleopolyhedrovirus A]AAQ11060.1 hypothetical protein [Mamestra configurata nucleopolyhedrovirus A]
MFRFKSNHVTVFVNDAETPFVSVVADCKDRIVTYKYCISTTTSAARLKVKLDTDHSTRLQAVFKCRQESMCIVNAPKRPVIFDGFVDIEDESRTNAFLIKNNLNSLKPDHGLRVREMARAMESPTILQIFVNEAIFANESIDCPFHLANSTQEEEDTAELYSLLDRMKTDYDDDKQLAHLRRGQLTNSRWAPVSCKTGRHLLTIRLKFLFTIL